MRERLLMTSTQFEIHSHAILYTTTDGTVLAEVTFPDVDEGIVDINHTFVDESLRGQGIASQLLEQTARELDETGRKARLTCSYAIKWFERHPEWSKLVA